jgi:uncharacterized protein (TIGR03790 family)
MNNSRLDSMQRVMSLPLYQIIYFLLVLLSFDIGTLYAVPGPDNVALLVNRNSESSMNLAQYYMEQRYIPISHRCNLDLTEDIDITLTQFKETLYLPLQQCLAGHLEHIEAIVMMRGTPLRVQIPHTRDDAPYVTLSTSSLLAWAHTKTRDGQSILDQSLIQTRPCGSNICWSAYYENPWRSGAFYSDWSRFKDQLEWKMHLVTRIDALDDIQAITLIDNASRSGISLIGTQTQEISDLQSYIHVFMQAANLPRAILDVDYEPVAQALSELGFDSEILSFDTNAHFDYQVASLMVGSQSLLEVVENNIYMPGSLVDNLTSFAAHPNNFDLNLPEVQAAITRWIPQGATGLHACTDEPLNDSFPSRWFLVDYVYGASLAEAFYRHIPFAFWQNIVLGDPMVAAYAQRPSIEHVILTDSSTIVKVEDALDRDIEYFTLWYNGELWKQTRGTEIIVCESTDIEVLAIAQVYGQMGQSVDHMEGWPAKGWKVIQIPACQPEDHRMLDMRIPPMLNDMSYMDFSDLPESIQDMQVANDTDAERAGDTPESMREESERLADMGLSLNEEESIQSTGCENAHMYWMSTYDYILYLVLLYYGVLRKNLIHIHYKNIKI